MSWTARSTKVFYWIYADGGGGLESRTLPLTHGACPVTRPCPHVSCRHHLALDPHVGRRTLNFIRPGVKDGDLSELVESCSLDFEGRPLDGEAIAKILGTGKARICRDLASAMDKIREEHPDLYERLRNPSADYGLRDMAPKDPGVDE
jgi:hypothetical protein